jgi:hypothetical protein
MAWVGSQMREDRPPSTANPPPTPGGVNELLMHPAYRDPKHPDHQRVTAQVSAFFNSQPGANTPV